MPACLSAWLRGRDRSTTPPEVSIIQLESPDTRELRYEKEDGIIWSINQLKRRLVYKCEAT